MDFANNGFEELEPRATPQPTLLKCMSDPSVPEVSLIFGKQLPPSHPPTTNRSNPEEKCRAYANWRTVGFASALDSRPVPQQTTNGRCNSASPRPKNGMPSNPSNFYAGSVDMNNGANSSSNSSPTYNNRDQPSAVQKHCFVAAPRDADDRSVYSYGQQYQDETAAFASPRRQLVGGPVPNGSYNAVRSILKSSLANSAVARPPTDGGVRSDIDFRSKSPSQSNHHHYKTRRHTDGSVYSPSSPVSRCQHTAERNHESDTVRDLLLLVKNQNEQIKSLQTQVERLLEIHEHNIGYLENRRSVVAKSTEKSQPLTYTYDTDNFPKSNVLVSAQRTCHSLGIGAIPSHPDEQPEVSARYQSDAMRNTIMEKKVSIGVMTSFEFSVQNNPFVSDSDNPSNGALRDCGKSASTPGDSWSPRNVVAGPLENISEDTESHPSSIWKQSSNNTQLTSSDKFASRLTPYGSENRGYALEAVSELSPNSKARRARNNGNDSSVAYSNKPSNESAAIGNSRSSKDRAPELSNKLIENSSKSEVRSPNNRGERKENVSHRQDGLHDYNRTAALESTNDSNLNKTERDIHRYSEQSNSERRSIPADNTADGSFVLCSSDVEVPDRSLLSLDPSIHVEMREYSSEDENEEAKRTPAVGWTFYKNVVGQVNRILHSMPSGQEVDENEKINPIAFNNDIAEKKDILNSVKTATLEQLKMLGISYAEHSQLNGEHTQRKVTFDSSYRPSVDYQTQNLTQQPSNSMTETNTSMHMRTLALKYLSDEQLADLAVHKQGVGAAMKHKFLSVQGTNMSFATMNYLQRYCLVSGMQTVNADGKGHGGATRQKKHLPMTKESQSPGRNRSFENAVHKGAHDNILDITTLKQQPKLL